VEHPLIKGLKRFPADLEGILFKQFNLMYPFNIKPIDNRGKKWHKFTLLYFFVKNRESRIGMQKGRRIIYIK